MERKTISMQITAKQLRHVDKWVKRLKKSQFPMNRSELIRRAIEKYLPQREGKK